MEDRSDLIMGAIGVLLWLIGLFLMARYKPARQWPRFMIWWVGLPVFSDLSKAFDAPGHPSVRSEILAWGGIALFVFMLIQARRTRIKDQQTVKKTEHIAA